MILSCRLMSCVAVCALAAGIGAGACSSNKSPGDAGADASGGGGRGGAGGGGTGGASGTGGQTGAGGGQAGGAGGSGGQGDAGACRMQGQSCSDSQRCCVGFICAGGCVMPPGSGSDAGSMCSYPDGGAPDGGAFNGVCPAGGCGPGKVCVVEIGGVAGGGGEYCAPIPNECHGTPTCACMAACACTNGVAGRPETCSEQNGTIACDNGIR